MLFFYRLDKRESTEIFSQAADKSVDDLSKNEHLTNMVPAPEKI
jgi:hypothetical protein